MSTLPWETVSSHEQFFVLITGANSGVGLGICQRVIREFLETRSLTSQIIVIPTTRSEKKSRQTIESLRLYVQDLATSTTLQSRAGPDYKPESTIARVHVLSVELDLCKLSTVYNAADRLKYGNIRDPTGAIANGKDVSIPRLDAAVFNAGYGGWSGLDWPEVARQIFTVGIVQATTFPSFKMAKQSELLPPQDTVDVKSPDGLEDKGQPQLAEVFCANTFGHYLFAHELLPLLSRSEPSETPGRIIWTSSIDAEVHHLDFDDFQALRNKGPYESSKRITDLMCLGVDLPSVQKVSSLYFSSPPECRSKPIKPRFYLSHPGIVHTALFPLNRFLFFCYGLLVYFARWLGSPWHTVGLYEGACAAAWLALADQETLDETNAQHVKWGSACDRCGHSAPKKTEVEGWGWEGKIEDNQALRRDKATGVLRKLRGRKWDAVQLTGEKKVRFEEDALKCWQELERLRIEWEQVFGRASKDEANGVVEPGTPEQKVLMNGNGNGVAKRVD